MAQRYPGGNAASKSSFTVLETWITVDQRPDRPDDRWFNTLLKVQVPFSSP